MPAHHTLKRNSAKVTQIINIDKLGGLGRIPVFNVKKKQNIFFMNPENEGTVMRTAKELSPCRSTVYECELEQCPVCHGMLSKCQYYSGVKIVQHLNEVNRIAYQPKICVTPDCEAFEQTVRSAQWLQIAPLGGTYGYDVIATIGWQRQEYCLTFAELHEKMRRTVTISESQVRYMYTHQYLPLLACHERSNVHRLERLSASSGLLLTLDGLAPEGGEAQLWVVRELRSGLTMRSGWMSQQDQGAFENFLRPIVATGLQVSVVLSDKQQGLVPAIHTVFPDAKHALCQSHYLKNLAKPIAAADETMKVQLRKSVRGAVGPLIRAESVEQPGVLTVTGLLPSPPESSPAEHEAASPQCQPDSRRQRSEPGEKTPTEEEQGDARNAPEETAPTIAQQRNEIVTVVQQRIRYVLTLKGRPPFRLAGVEMYDRLTEVEQCVQAMLDMEDDPRLRQLQQGLTDALSEVQGTYQDLRQATQWLEEIARLLDPEGHPERTGQEVQEQLFEYLDTLEEQGPDKGGLQEAVSHIRKTTQNYASGLFHTYDIEDLPRTNNDRESEFRKIIQHMLRTTGQQGGTRRIILRSGAWEAIPHPETIEQTIEAFSEVAPEELHQERERVSKHRKRFRTHTRSAKQSQKQLEHLQKQWAQLAHKNGPL